MYLNFAPQKHCLTMLLGNRMANQADQINLEKILFDENNSERKSWSCTGHSCSRSLIVFLSQFFVILIVIPGKFWRIHLSKSWTRVQFGWEFCLVLLESLSLLQEYEKTSFYKKKSFHFFSGTRRIRKISI